MQQEFTKEFQAILKNAQAADRVRTRLVDITEQAEAHSEPPNVDTAARGPQLRSQTSPFCPDIALSPENDELWITLNDVGKVQVFSAKPPFEQRALFDTGPITNRFNFANNRNGKFAYVTLGGANQVKVFRRGPMPELIVVTKQGEQSPPVAQRKFPVIT